MTKQRTDNLELILLNDHDEDSFYADHLENLGKIEAADRAQKQLGLRATLTRWPQPRRPPTY